MASLDRGEGIPLDESRERIPQWTSKDSTSERLLPLAQTAWAADWDTQEEDEAWRGLEVATFIHSAKSHEEICPARL